LSPNKNDGQIGIKQCAIEGDGGTETGTRTSPPRKEQQNVHTSPPLSPIINEGRQERDRHRYVTSSGRASTSTPASSSTSITAKQDVIKTPPQGCKVKSSIGASAPINDDAISSTPVKETNDLVMSMNQTRPEVVQSTRAGTPQMSGRGQHSPVDEMSAPSPQTQPKGVKDNKGRRQIVRDCECKEAIHTLDHQLVDMIVKVSTCDQKVEKMQTEIKAQNMQDQSENFKAAVKDMQKTASIMNEMTKRIEKLEAQGIPNPPSTSHVDVGKAMNEIQHAVNKMSSTNAQLADFVASTVTQTSQLTSCLKSFKDVLTKNDTAESQLNYTLLGLQQSITSLENSSAAQTVKMDSCLNNLRHSMDNTATTNMHVEETMCSLKQSLDSTIKKGYMPNETNDQNIPAVKQGPAKNNTSGQSAGKVHATYVLVQGPRDPLSNFYNCKIESTYKNNPLVYKSVEHAIQHKKAVHQKEFDIARDILQCATAVAAKKLGDTLPKLQSWHNIQLEVMEDLLDKKTKVCPAFKNKLLQNKSAHLLHTVADTFWGIGVEPHDIVHPINIESIRAENQHGRLLERIRDKLCSEATAATAEKSPSPAAHSDSKSIAQNIPHATKPRAVLMGNSLLNGIDHAALSQQYKVERANAATVEVAMDKVKNWDKQDTIDCLCLQLITNEARNIQNPAQTVENCSKGIADLISITNDKWPSCKIVVSLPPPRGDSDKSHHIQSVVSSFITLQSMANDHLTVVNNDDFGIEGYPDTKFYQDDQIHLNQRGKNHLVSKLKKGINSVLQLC
jgi:ribA/ribD-fused uncharacterized protein